MQDFFSTRQVARLLNVKPDALMKAVWLSRVDAPAKSPSGAYLWTVSNIEKAAWVLHKSNHLKVVELLRRLSNE